MERSIYVQSQTGSTPRVKICVFQAKEGDLFPTTSFSQDLETEPEISIGSSDTGNQESDKAFNSKDSSLANVSHAESGFFSQSLFDELERKVNAFSIGAQKFADLVDGFVAPNAKDTPIRGSLRTCNVCFKGLEVVLCFLKFEEYF